MADSKTTDGQDQSGQTLTLHGYGDRELFYAQSADSSWSLPMFVEWKHDKITDKHYALVTPAVTLYVNQGLVMQALLQVHDLMGEKNRWLIPRNICEAILHKAPGITPVFYYRWPDVAQPPLPPKWKEMQGKGWTYPSLKDEDRMAKSQPFIKHVAAVSGIPSSVVSIVFKTICQEATAWMLNNKQPLDMGFCQLVALPFRINWKEIIAFKCKSWKLRQLFTEAKRDEDLHARLAELKMPSVMCSPQNIGLSSGRLQHTLEVIPTKKFHDAVNESEKERVSCGWNAYVAHYEESVEKYYHLMVRALGHYIKKAAVPFARVHGSGVSGVVRFLPVGAAKALVHGVAVKNIPSYIIPSDSNFSVTSEQSDPRLVQIQTEKVLQVSTVLPATKNLRQCDGIGEVGQPRPGGAVRVPLLLTDQKRDGEL